MKYYLSLFLIFNFLIIFSQEYFPTNSGVKNSTENFIAFTNATIHIDPSRTIKNGTLLIQGQKIINAGKNITLPKNCIVRDLDSKHIYDSFIDIYTNFGITKPKKIGNPGYKQQYDATRKGYYWNDHIMPDQIGCFVKLVFRTDFQFRIDVVGGTDQSHFGSNKFQAGRH